LKNQSQIDVLSEDQQKYITDIEAAVNARVALVGTGPSTMAWVK
jgi:adenylosuccinate synthase